MHRPRYAEGTKRQSFDPTSGDGIKRDRLSMLEVEVDVEVEAEVEVEVEAQVERRWAISGISTSR